MNGEFQGSSSEPGRDEDAARQADLPRLSIWLVDAYNTLHCLPGLRDEDPEHRAADRKPEGARWWSTTNRERLVALARRFADPDAEILLVFDGAHPPAESEPPGTTGVTIHFAPSADEWIVRSVRRAEDPGRIGVVTRDRKVADRSRHHGAVVLSPQSFLGFCSRELSI